MSARAAGQRRRHEEELAEILAQHGDLLRGTARELLSTGRAHVIVGTVTVDAELLAFWRGDRILRIQHTAAGQKAGGSAFARFPRHNRPDSEEIIAHYLASALTHDSMHHE